MSPAPASGMSPASAFAAQVTGEAVLSRANAEDDDRDDGEGYATDPTPSPGYRHQESRLTTKLSSRGRISELGVPETLYAASVCCSGWFGATPAHSMRLDQLPQRPHAA